MSTTEATQQRRHIGILMGAQALGGASPPIIISLGGIVGQTLASDPGLATLPVSLFNLGVALSTLPVAWMMRRHSRRGAYLTGATLGCLAGLIAAIAIMQSSFLLFCVGTALAGFYGACVQSYRFAAADAVPAGQRPLAISRVMVGGLAAAIIGPQLVIWTRDSLPGLPFAGSFYAQAALALLAIPLLMLLPRGHAPAAAPAAHAPPAGPARSARDIARSSAFLVPAVVGMVSYAAMSFLMTATPMAMVGCGHTVGEAALGIQWHVLAMFGPSFFTGRLITRFGKPAIIITGLVLIALSSVVALSGLDLHDFWGALILLGLGWNLSFLGATAMIADSFQGPERSKAQSMNDFLIFGSVALSSFGSGQMLATLGWDAINRTAIVIMVITITLVLAYRMATRQRLAA